MNLSKTLSVTCAALLLAAGVAQAKPQVYVTGTVKYDPAKTFNSYVIMATKGTTKMIDRNGNLVKEWDNKSNGYAMPPKAFPGGIVGISWYNSLPTGGQDNLTSTATWCASSTDLKRWAKFPARPKTKTEKPGYPVSITTSRSRA